MKKSKHDKLVKDYDKQKERHLERLATKMLKNADINEKLKTQFPNILVYSVIVTGNFDSNELQVAINYTVQNTSIKDDLTLSFQ